MLDAAAAPSDWPGKRLGLPPSGPRSIAGFGRRLAAIAVDWALASLAGFLLFPGERFAPLIVFAVLQYAFIVTVSGSVGHLLLGLRVVPTVPAWIGLWRPFVRTLLLCLLLPALIWGPGQRGLHDQLAATVLVRR